MSELMLQQTQVARVVPKYEAFLSRFPDPEVCAAAPLAEVIVQWQGLGYNRRAVNLHRAALAVCEDHGGTMPRTLVELLRLPGVGPYTARAVLAFSYESDVGVVDTNAARVLARWTGRTLDRREVQAAADTHVPTGRAWLWNQAILDLGATVCTSRSPRCERCPTTTTCGWALGGRDDPDPAIGSAGLSGKQSTFDGSDRQGRGRLVDVLRSRPGGLSEADVAAASGWPDDPARAARVVRTLVEDGLVHWHRGRLRLGSPHEPAARP